MYSVEYMMVKRNGKNNLQLPKLNLKYILLEMAKIVLPASNPLSLKGPMVHICCKFSHLKIESCQQISLRKKIADLKYVQDVQIQIIESQRRG